MCRSTTHFVMVLILLGGCNRSDEQSRQQIQALQQQLAEQKAERARDLERQLADQKAEIARLRQEPDHPTPERVRADLERLHAAEQARLRAEADGKLAAARQRNSEMQQQLAQEKRALEAEMSALQAKLNTAESESDRQKILGDIAATQRASKKRQDAIEAGGRARGTSGGDDPIGDLPGVR